MKRGMKNKFFKSNLESRERLNRMKNDEFFLCMVISFSESAIFPSHFQLVVAARFVALAPLLPQCVY